MANMFSVSWLTKCCERYNYAGEHENIVVGTKCQYIPSPKRLGKQFAAPW